MGGGCYSVKAIKGKFSPARYSTQMGYETAVIKGVEPTNAHEMLERGAHLRSDLLDAFARLEEVICEKLGDSGKGLASQSLTQKLNALEKAPFRYPTKAKQRIAEIRSLVDCRNDIVHSVLSIADISGSNAGSYLVFRNVSGIPGCTGREFRALTLEEFKTLVGRAKIVAKQLNDQPLKAATPAAPASASG